MKPIDFLDGANAAYLDEMYARWSRDPSSVDEMWNAFFSGFEAGWKKPPPPGARKGNGAADAVTPPPSEGGSKGAYGLVNAYREFGHLVAKLDPLGDNLDAHPYLDLAAYGFEEGDLDKAVGEGGFLGPHARTLRELRDNLEKAYCGTVATQVSDIPNETMRSWFYDRVERPRASRTTSGSPSSPGSARRRASSSSSRPSTWARSASPSRAASRSSPCSRPWSRTRPTWGSRSSSWGWRTAAA